MAVEILLLTATTLIALVAVTVAVVAVREVRRLSSQMAGSSAVEMATSGFEGSFAATSTIEAATSTIEAATSTIDLPVELAPRAVQGRVIVPPTQAQVVRTALGRPGVRLSIFAHGLARALRAENRDRIVSVMRREYRHRRRERLRAGRQAVRAARPTASPSTERLHAEFAEPRSLGISERMIGS
jgi:hypothetical protein